MGHLVEQAIRAGATLGEGPSWDDRSGRLVFVDILAGHVLAATPGGDPVVLLDAGQAVGAARLREAGGLVAAVRDGFLLVDAEGTIERHIPVEADDQ